MRGWWENVALALSTLGAVSVVTNPEPDLVFLRWEWLQVLIVLGFGYLAFDIGKRRGQRFDGKDR